MGKQSTTLSVLVDVNAKVDKAKAAIEVFKNSLSNLKLSDSLSGNVNKILTKLETEFANFQGLSEKEIFSEKDSKQVKKSFETIIDLMNTLQAHANTIEGLDVSKLIPKDFIDQIKSFGKELKTLADEQKALDSSLEQKTKEKTVAEDKYSKALKARSDLQKKIDSNKNTQAAAAEEQAKAQKRINDLLEQKKTIESKKTKADEEIKQKKKELEEVDNLIKKYQEYQKLKKKDNKTSQEKSKVTRFENQNQDIINKGRSGALTKRKNNLEAEVVKLETIELSSDEIAKLQQVEEAIQKEEQIINQQKAIATKAKNNIAKSTIDLNVLKDTDGLDALKTEFETLEKEVNAFNSTLDPTKLDSFRQKIADFAGVKLDEIPTDLAEIEKYLIKIQSTKVEEISKDLEGIGETAKEIKAPMEELRKSVNKLGETGKSFDDVNNDIQRLKQNIIDFFSIGNAVQLFKRAVKSAFDTVKELDATMTEAAVVTDFSIGDMWDKLPEYSGEASKLGATINDLYGATTLYYQQGLKTNEAMALGIETMKMARIANMEAKDATEAMTAALRGFNMELNETSATRVNDVYSELAAITAADTEQIATAMSKTASIASAANMEFESTAAFLSQIIETTQEAPETAGTALKTIIARFSEVKSLREKGLSSGEDSEGELIDVNKIQGALRTVGISMDEFFAGTEGLDSVLMKLASKWETLDFETQRYIATTAAGSRQQSRFIAMMSDYDRTMELVGAANNSAGASQEQFNKTLESLDAKLNNLKNAWDQFVMGLANNEVLKAVIDVLTFILETINKLLSTLSGGSGIIKTFLTAFMAIKGFSLGKKAIGGIFGGITGLFGGEGKVKRESISLGQRIGTYVSQGIQSIKTKDMSNILLDKMGFTQSDISKAIKGRNLQRSFNLDQLDFSKAKIDFGTELGQNIKNNLNKQISAANISPDVKINLRTDLLNGDLQNLQKNAQAAGVPLKILGQDAAQAGAQIYKMQASVQTLTMTASAAGMGLMMLLGPLEKIGASEKVIGVIKAIATALMVLPVVFKIVEGAVHVFAKSATAAISSIPIIGWISAAISVIIALVGVLTTLIETEEERLERLQENAEKTHEAAEQVKSDYENINSTLESLGQKEADLNKLTKGTDEWKKAVRELNQEILELIKLDPEILKYGFIKNEGGVLKIDTESDGYKQYLDEQMQEVTDSNTAVAAADLAVSEQELKVERNDFAFMRGDTNYVKKVNQKFRETGDYSSTAAFKRETQNNNASGTNRLNKKEFAEAEKNYEEIDRVIEEALINQSIDFSKGEDAVKEYVRSMAESGQLNIDLTKDSQGKDYIDKYFYSTYNFDKIADYYGDMELKGIDNQAILMGEKMANLEAANIDEENYDLVSAYQDQIYLDTFRKISNDDIELNDELKESYANAQGYKFRNNKFYSVDKETGAETEVSIDEDTLIQYGKLKETNVQVQDKISQFSEGIKEIQLDNPKVAKNIENLLLKQGAGVTENLAQELEQLFTTDDEGNKVVKNQEDFNAKYQEWGGDAIFGSIENFTNLLQNSLDNYNQNINNINQNWSSMLSQEALSDPNNIMGQAIVGGTLDLSKIISGIDGVDLTAGQFEGLANSLMKVYRAGGNVEEFGAGLSSILSSIDEDKIPEVLNLLSTKDFSDANQIDLTISALREMGVELDESFVKSLKESAKAIQQINLEEFEKQLKSLGGSIDKVAEKVENSSSAFSKEDMDELLSLGIDGLDRSQFSRSGIDEYIYLGDMESLLSSLDGNVSSILSTIKSEIDSQVAEGEKIDAYMSKDAGWTSGGESYTNRQAVLNVVNGKWGVEDFSTEDSINSLKRMGLEIGLKEDVVESSSVENLIAAIKERVETYWGTSGEIYDTNLIKQDEIEADEAQLIKNKQSSYSFHDEIGDSQRGGYKYVREGTSSEAEGRVEFDESGQIKWSKDSTKASDAEKLTSALITQAKQFGVNESIINKFTKALKDNKGYLDVNTAAILENAIADKKAQKSLGKTVTGVKEITDKYEDLKEITDEDINNIVDELGLSDLEGEVSNFDFVKDNLDLINKAVNGDIEAMQQFQDKLAEQYGVTIDAKTGFVDMSEIVNAAGEVEQSALDAINALIEAGYYEVETVEVEKSGFYDAPIFDPATGLITGTKKVYYEAGQTYQVVKPAEAPNIREATGSTKSGGGGGGGSKKTEKQHWENPYDELYNTQQKVDETLRERNQLEREYDRLLENRDVSAAKLLENQAKQLKNLRQEYDLQKKIAKQELKEITSKNSKKADYLATHKKGDEEEQVWTTFQAEATRLGMGDLDKWAKYNTETNEIEINWKAIEALEDDTAAGEDKGSLIEAYISYLEENSDSYEEVLDRLEEIEDEIAEIKKKAMQDYIDFEQKVYDALVQQAQQEIDDMQALSDTLSEANSSILDSLQESIDLERQIRDNTKQEEDIADMEARLAYLRRDTSGANVLEIKQLEEQLGDARESYSDSLVDQQLQKLSDDNAKAEEQRQQQIELAQAQLDYWTEIGYFWPKVDELITEAAKAEDFSETDLADVLKDTEGFKGMSYFGKKNWMYELAQEFALAGQGKSNWKVEEAEQAGKLKKGQVVDEKGKSVGALTYDKKNKVWKDSNGGTYDTLTWDEAQGKYVATGYTPKKEDTPPNGTPIGDPTTETYPYGKPSEATKTVKRGQSGQQVKAVQYALNKLGYGNSGTSSVDGKFGSNTEKAVKAFQSAMGISKDGVVGPKTRAKFKLKKFKTGGIADFTGPAWLDGTKSKPEIILNQQDSKNFIMLKDVLGEILQGATSGKDKTSGGGDNYFDISIIVDEISSDYDVDQMAARIKQQIYEDSTYRNVNAINLIR